jgi:hypothetical protein
VLACGAGCGTRRGCIYARTRRGPDTTRHLTCAITEHRP